MYRKMIGIWRNSTWQDILKRNIRRQQNKGICVKTQKVLVVAKAINSMDSNKMMEPRRWWVAESSIKPRLGVHLSGWMIQFRKIQAKLLWHTHMQKQGSRRFRTGNPREAGTELEDEAPHLHGFMLQKMKILVYSAYLWPQSKVQQVSSQKCHIRQKDIYCSALPPSGRLQFQWKSRW